MFLGEDDERQYLYPPEFHRGFFRLAVGLEDTDDLIRDIDHALAEAGFEAIELVDVQRCCPFHFGLTGRR